MNVRLFMLVAMTAFFGVLWSSDREYQETQMSVARAAREAAAIRETASINTLVAPTNDAPWAAMTATPSIAIPAIEAPSIVAFSITLPLAAEPSPVAASLAEPIRQPVVAPHVAKERPIQIASFLVSFRRPSFYFEGRRLFDDVSRGEGTNPQGSGVTNIAGLLRWAGRIRAEIEGETCWMRWQMRRSTFSAQRRLSVLLSKNLDWYAFAEKVARGTLWQFDAVPTNAAARATDEKR